MNATTYNMTAGYGMTAEARERRVPATFWTHAKNVALFAAAPFIGLAYIVLFPFVGLAMLAWMGAKAAMKSEKVRTTAMIATAPVIGLVFVTVGPVMALGALAWTAAKAVHGT